MKVVINNCFGGFGLSAKAVRKYAELCGFDVFAYADRRMLKNIYDSKDRTIVKLTDEQEEEKNHIIYWIKNDLGEETTSEKLNSAEWFHDRDIKRNDDSLIKTIKLLKKEANGRCASLKVVTIPDNVDYEIDEYDGLESIHEKHRSWS